MSKNTFQIWFRSTTFEVLLSKMKNSESSYNVCACVCYLTAALGIEPYTRELRPLYRPLTPWLFTVCFTQSPASRWRRCSSSVVNMRRQLHSRQEEASLYFHCQQCTLFVGAPSREQRPSQANTVGAKVHKLSVKIDQKNQPTAQTNRFVQVWTRVRQNRVLK